MRGPCCTTAAGTLRFQYPRIFMAPIRSFRSLSLHLLVEVQANQGLADSSRLRRSAAAVASCMASGTFHAGLQHLVSQQRWQLCVSHISLLLTSVDACTVCAALPVSTLCRTARPSPRMRKAALARALSLSLHGSTPQANIHCKGGAS